MSIHWDVNLNIECSNNEEAVKLANYLTDNYEEDSYSKVSIDDSLADEFNEEFEVDD